MPCTNLFKLHKLSTFSNLIFFPEFPQSGVPRKFIYVKVDGRDPGT